MWIKRLEKNGDLLKVYGDIIQEQEARGFIERVQTTDVPSDRPVHYIPHHPIEKESSTTPIRIVYECSCKDGTGSVCLNDCLESHPPIVNDITGILTRFRAKNTPLLQTLRRHFCKFSWTKRTEMRRDSCG